MTIRLWHTYLGFLMAPSVLFFALTGAVQLFSLHEAHDNYHPPALIEKLSAVHKDQVFAVKEHEDDHADHSHDQDAHDEEPSVSTYVLKWYFLVVALALTVSTLLGLWMGLTNSRLRRMGWTLLAIGTIVPVGLTLF
jgi:hypothetical protein